MARYDFRPFLAAAVLAAMVACARNEEPAESMTAEAAMAPAAEVAAPAPALEAAAGSDAGAPAAVQLPGVDPGQLASRASTAVDPQRRFVRTAGATFQVKDVYAATLAIEDAVAAQGGFVVRNEISTQVVGQQERPLGGGDLLRLSQVVTQGTLEVRVPSERMQAFLRAIAKQMQFLDARSFAARDMQFELLRRQLAFERAQALQRELRSAGAQPGKTGEKIDAVEARAAMLAARDEARVAQRELDDRIAFGTLTLQLRQPAQVREQVVPDVDAILRERGPGFFSEAGQALQAGWRGLLAAIVALAALWPLWVCVAIGGYGWLRMRRRRRALAVATTQPSA